MNNETNINGIVFLRSYFESIEELEGSDKINSILLSFNILLINNYVESRVNYHKKVCIALQCLTNFSA